MSNRKCRIVSAPRSLRGAGGAGGVCGGARNPAATGRQGAPHNPLHQYFLCSDTPRQAGAGNCLTAARAGRPPHLCMTSGWYCRPKMRRPGFSIATMAPCSRGGAQQRAHQARRYTAGWASLAGQHPGSRPVMSRPMPACSSASAKSACTSHPTGPSVSHSLPALQLSPL